jgi:hypothetical protein
MRQDMPLSRCPLRIAAGVTACCYAPVCAYCWALPHNVQSLGSFLLGLALITLPGVAAFLIGLARRGLFRFGLPFLLLALVGPVPAIGALAGGCPGGWLIWIAGALVGALVGLASGWLVLRWTQNGRQESA